MCNIEQKSRAWICHYLAFFGRTQFSVVRFMGCQTETPAEDLTSRGKGVERNLMDGTRRGFFRAAVTVAGAAAGAAAAPGLAQGQEHQAIPSDLTLRVKSLESLLVDKGLVDRVALDRIVDAFETQDRSEERRARRRARVGRSGIQKEAIDRRVDRNGGARLPSSSGRRHRRAREHARKSITWSSARCARATRGRSSAFHRSGTSRHRIVRVRSSTPAAC